jgi:UDP-2,3-diacylglucosamine pyrophosphatase LpxH
MLDTALFSDLHRGDRRSNLVYMRELFLHVGKAHRVILIGDVLDSWTADSWDVEELLEALGSLLARELICVRGNHDPDNLDKLLGDRFTVVDQYDLETKRGLYAVMHGHQYDDMICKYSYWMRILYWIHDAVLRAFHIDMQRLLQFSLSSRNKSRYFKNLVADSVRRMREDLGGKYKGVVCGHTHFPTRVLCGDFEYINSGDLLTNMTYVKVEQDGEISVYGYFPTVTG